MRLREFELSQYVHNLTSVDVIEGARLFERKKKEEEKEKEENLKKLKKKLKNPSTPRQRNCHYTHPLRGSETVITPTSWYCIQM